MFTLELSEQMVMTIVASLGNHPYREAAPVIAELQKQVNSQMLSRRTMNGGAEEQRANNVQHQSDNH